MDCILKSNSKFVILKSKNSDKKNIVVKYDLRHKHRIHLEFKRINLLKKKHAFYKKHLVDIKDLKKQDLWLFKNIYSYQMPYISGESLSTIIRNQEIDFDTKNNITKKLYEDFIAISEKHTENSLIGKKMLWNTKCKTVLDQIIKVDYINHLLSSPLNINGDIIKDPKNTLLEFFNKKNKSFIPCNQIHGNFHGENIIIPDISNKNNYKLIDPDCSLKDVDSTFSVARFLYTYIHDTVEQKKYIITSILNNSKKNHDFFYDIVWDKSIKKSYSIFDRLIKNLVQNFYLDEKSNRLFKSYILCLMLGILANDNGFKLSQCSNNRIQVNSNAYFILLNIFNYIKPLI